MHVHVMTQITNYFTIHINKHVRESESVECRKCMREIEEKKTYNITSRPR
jgi:hypothetical protein